MKADVDNNGNPYVIVSLDGAGFRQVRADFRMGIGAEKEMARALRQTADVLDPPVQDSRP